MDSNIETQNAIRHGAYIAKNIDMIFQNARNHIKKQLDDLGVKPLYRKPEPAEVDCTLCDEDNTVGTTKDGIAICENCHGGEVA